EHDDRRLFEFLLLEGAQAGLSWITVLKKREHYRRAFDEFDPEKIARYDQNKLQTLARDEGIIRNRRKIASSVQNAQAFLRITRSGSFAEYLWQFVDGQPRQNSWQHLSEIPAKTMESSAMSNQLRKDGFNFVGPTICYAFMQATGMVNDHLITCFRHAELSGN
ncbi:MAG: DNA-3-methyladenine glycosylase I, partial [Kangiella sp.]|nr:DNA-3-methyladenine glycosylase I [Kangiella sp.]